jgi:hypothetical protein
VLDNRRENNMLTVTRTFDWDNRLRNGWRPIECPDFSAGNGFMVAHDTLEHFNRNEKFEGELLAFGTTMWSRMSKFSLDQEKQIDSSGSDLSEFLADQKYMVREPSPYMKKLLLPIEQEVLLERFIEKASYYSGEPDFTRVIFSKTLESVEKFNMALPKIMPWIRLGFKMAQRKYKDPETFLKMFVTVQRAVNNNHDLYLPILGDELKVSVDFTTLICTLEHSRFQPTVYPMLKEI